MRIFNIFFSVLFIIFAVLQYNDPDPYIWIPLYLYGAFLSYYWFFKNQKLAFYYVALLIYAAYAVYLFFDKTGVLNWANEHHAESIAGSMKARSPWIEETREFFGLVILMAVVIINVVFIKRKRLSAEIY